MNQNSSIEIEETAVNEQQGGQDNTPLYSKAESSEALGCFVHENNDQLFLEVTTLLRTNEPKPQVACISLHSHELPSKLLVKDLDHNNAENNLGGPDEEQQTTWSELPAGVGNSAVAGMNKKKKG